MFVSPVSLPFSYLTRYLRSSPTETVLTSSSKVCVKRSGEGRIWVNANARLAPTRSPSAFVRKSSAWTTLSRPGTSKFFPVIEIIRCSLTPKVANRHSFLAPVALRKPVPQLPGDGRGRDQGPRIHIYQPPIPAEKLDQRLNQ